MGLSWLQSMHSFPATVNAQYHDGEHIIEAYNGNHIGIVIEQYIATVMLSCIVFSVYFVLLC